MAMGSKHQTRFSRLRPASGTQNSTTGDQHTVASGTKPMSHRHGWKVEFYLLLLP